MPRGVPVGSSRDQGSRYAASGSTVPRYLEAQSSKRVAPRLSLVVRLSHSATRSMASATSPVGFSASDRPHEVVLDPVGQDHLHGMLQLHHLFQAHDPVVVDQLQGVLRSETEAWFREIRRVVLGRQRLVEVRVVGRVIRVLEVSPLWVQELGKLVPGVELGPDVLGPAGEYRRPVGRLMGEEGHGGIPDEEDVPVGVGVGEVGRVFGLDPHGRFPFLQLLGLHHPKPLFPEPVLAKGRGLEDEEGVGGLEEDRAQGGESELPGGGSHGVRGR